MGVDKSTQCNKCGKEIVGRALKAKELVFHAEKCFVCSECGKDLRSLEVFSKEGKLFCEAHYKSKFLPKCAKCCEYITERCVRALNKTWHAGHFSCYSCNAMFTEHNVAHVLEEKPYCERCYANNALPRCRGCAKPIRKSAIVAMRAKWHEECFVCNRCKTSFHGMDNFFSVNEKPVCAPCAGILA